MTGPARCWLAALLVVSSVGCGLPRWPVDAPITSPFGLRVRGFLPGIHRGVDLAAPEGTPVHAMSSGSVRFAGFQRGYGNVVWLDHGRSVLTVYAHLSAIRVTAGASVRGGEVIGLSGSSGDASGPHLHFEVWRWGREADPVPLLGGRPGGSPGS